MAKPGLDSRTPFSELSARVNTSLQGCFASLLTASSAANLLPQGADYDYLSTYSSFKGQLDPLGRRVLDLAQSFLDLESVKASSPTSLPNLRQIESVDDSQDAFDEITELIDSTLENVDEYLDDVTGAKPETNIAISKSAAISLKGTGGTIFYSSNVPRPQEQWKDDVDNSLSPFVPKLRFKPNAKVPLDKSIVNQQLDNYEITDPQLLEHMQGLGMPQQPTSYPHPYEFELRSLVYEPWMLASREPLQYSSLESTPVHWIDNEAALISLCSVLDSCTEFAVDLEAHQYRSYQGFCCLMQISTPTEDYLIDTLALRRQMYRLNSSFTNPNIVKVFHGADFDIQWLQRDFGIYVVNMFDTGQASRVLEMPSYALSYLLKFYCGIVANKQYQKADWRVRPLPAEMFLYAREDTHYLLYIYHQVRNEALNRVGGDTQLLMAILNRSRQLCLTRYEKEPFDENTSYQIQLARFHASLDLQQIQVFAAVFAWRDRIARLEDESTRYVLPNHMILQIATKMPSDDAELLAATVPAPPLVKMNIPELLKVIRDAKVLGQQKKTSAFAAAAAAASSASSIINQRNNNNSFGIYGHYTSSPSSTSTPYSPNTIASTPTSSTNFRSSNYSLLSTDDNNNASTSTLPDLPIDAASSEELYRQAGWVVPTNNNHFNNSNNNNGHHEDSSSLYSRNSNLNNNNKNPSSNTSLSSVSSFFSSRTEYSSAQPLPPAPIFELTSDGQTLSSSSSSGTSNSHRNGNSNGDNNNNILIGGSNGSTLISPHSLFANSTSSGTLFKSDASIVGILNDSTAAILLPAADLESRVTAETIRSSFNIDWLHPPSSVPSYSTQQPTSSSINDELQEELSDGQDELPTQSKNEEQVYESNVDQQDDNDDEEDNEEQEEEEEEEEEEDNTTGTTTNNEDFFNGVPRSMQDIYNLSNQTKRRKKKREVTPSTQADVLMTPTSGGSATQSESPFFLNDGTSELDIRAVKRAKTAETTSDQDILLMKDVGWEADTPTKLPASIRQVKQSQQQQQNGHSTGSKRPNNNNNNNNNNIEITPFDYSKHKATRPPPGPAQKAAQRGQTKEQLLNPYHPSHHKGAKRGGRGGRGGGGAGHNESPNRKGPSNR